MPQFNFKKILETLVGSDKEFALEHRIFSFVTAMCLSSALPGVIYFIIEYNLPLILLLLVTNFFYGYSYWLSRVKKQLQKSLLVFFVFQAINLNIFWLIGYGSQGTAGFLLFVILIMVAFTANNPIPYLIGLFVNLVLLCIFDTYLMQLINFSLPFEPVAQKVAFLMAILYASILILLYKQLIRRRLDKTYFDVMGQLDVQSTTVNNTADSLVETSRQLLAFALQQKSATEQLSVTTEELGATAEQNHQLSSSAMSTLKVAENNIHLSRETIASLANSIEEIKRSSSEIQTINNVINDIAFQTNILSLNAMIEASRSGSANSGFKVVALEVKRLAERSAKAVESIDKLLNNNLNTVKQSVNFAAEMNERFLEISESMRPLASVVQNVADASAEQHEAIRQITSGIADIDRAVDENQSLAGASSETANELRNNAASLKSVVILLQKVVEDA